MRRGRVPFRSATRDADKAPDLAQLNYQPRRAHGSVKKKGKTQAEPAKAATPSSGGASKGFAARLAGGMARCATPKPDQESLNLETRKPEKNRIRSSLVSQRLHDRRLLKLSNRFIEPPVQR